MIEPIVPRVRRIAMATLAALSGLIVLNHALPVAASAAENSDGTAYVLMAPGSRDTTMSGSMHDIRRARALRSRQEGLLYIRRGGAEYVIRDPATLRRAEEIFQPQKDLGSRQAALGSQQAALGHRQAGLGAEQGRLGRQQAGASARRAEALGRQQEALGRQQEALGRQQEALGRQQDALGREQERLSRIAEARIGALLTEAIRSGVARRVD